MKLIFLFVLLVPLRGQRFDLMPSPVMFGVDPDNPESCKPVPQSTLRTIHGPAFNARYMSTQAPNEIDSSRINRHGEAGSKPGETIPFPSFDVDEGFNEVLSYKPAWMVPDGGTPNPEVTAPPSLDRLMVKEGEDQETTRRRRIRESREGLPWHCKATVTWLDLGQDYFPRYQRSVLCEQRNCWYGTFECRARSFTVKVLRRAGGRCVYNNGTSEGLENLGVGMYESWVWEERAVAYCCDCVVVSSNYSKR